MDGTALLESEPTFDLDDPALYLNRELSWLEFNRRVLAEAHDARNPLLERVRFLAITASNLDEFFAKRVGWLKRGIRTDPRMVTVDGLTMADQLPAVLRECHAMRRDCERHWLRTLLPALGEHGVRVVRFADLDSEAQGRLRGSFEKAIFPVLTPLVVDPAHPFPFISGGSLSLAMNVRDPRTGTERFARVKVPQNRPRFIDAGHGRYVLIEEVIASHAHMLFPGMEITDWQEFRIIRSAEIGSPGEESDDLLELIESNLRRRRLAEAVTVEVTGTLPHSRLELVLEELELEESDVCSLEGPLGLSDLFQVAGLNLPDLTFKPFVPAIPSAFVAVPGEATSPFAVLRERDVLVHHPYESFESTVVEFIDEAADDPAVLAIKGTMYRTSADSPILASLIDASGRGKQVAVLVELTARFDEANNIEWARKLEDAGVHVAYGLPNLKIHSKIALVVREEAQGVTMYAHIGTGNYNRRTARLYTDFGLFTSDPGICADLVHVFNYLTGFGTAHAGRDLIVAPAGLRPQFERRIRREIETAKAGRPARIIMKMNALEDREFTRLFYEASQAGVKVDLIIRGICRLRPGIPGLSDNVRVTSVIGRFLEHSRVFMFSNDGDPELFIGSADLMKRNLDERIEVIAPIRAAAHKQQLLDYLDLLLADRRQGWQLHDSAWSRDEGATATGSQAELLARSPFS